jgi:hypothetical protein
MGNNVANQAQELVGSIKNIRYELPWGAPDIPLRRVFKGVSRPGKDAVQTLRYLKFARHLKNLSKTDEAMNDAIEAAYGDDEGAATELKETKPSEYKATQLYQSRLKLDAVTMNIERRELQDLCRNRPDTLVSGHLFTDGSPVTGNELQGQILQLCFICGLIKTIVLPGVVMHYGSNSVIMKVVAFLWALYLILGPNEADMQWICSKMASVTSDMGTEFGFIDTPNFIHDFFERLRGVSMERLAGTVDPSSRLFPIAIRVSGWGHVFGKLMFYSTKHIATWPALLQAIRNLCAFFRNESWRREVIRLLKDEVPNISVLLKSFRGKIAKWRYETLHVVFTSLLKLRSICETHLVRITTLVGDEFADKPFLVNVQAACQWKELWSFMFVFLAKVLNPLEHARRWGLLCPCCKELRDNVAKKVRCIRSSRRLHEARLFVKR